MDVRFLGVNNRRWELILSIIQVLALQPVDMFAVRYAAEAGEYMVQQ